jgi:uncharacterized secreted protein with C-terminal beta-propeller domain
MVRRKRSVNRRSTGRTFRLERLEERYLLDRGFTQFGSADAFRQYLREKALADYKDLFGQHRPAIDYRFYGSNLLHVDQAVPAAFAQTQAAADSSTSFPQTNVQVRGVDEGDLVKTDGSYIYTLTHQELDIVQAFPATSLHIASQTPIEGYAYAEYLEGDRLAVLSTVLGSAGQDVQPLVQTADGFGLIFPSYSKTKVTVFDVSDRSAPREVQTVYVDGAQLASRAIGNRVYLVMQNYFAGLPGPAYTTFNGESIYESEADYLARVDGNELQLALPHYYVRPGGGDQPLEPAGYLTDPAQVYKPQSPDEYNLISVMVFDMAGDAPTPTATVSFFGSYASTLYANTDHLYLALPRWGGDNPGSSIVQLTLDGSQVTLTASGFVTGQVLNQFSMDEQGPYLRVATTANWGANATNNLYVLARDGEQLNVVGKIEDLAHGERIMAASFLGTRAILVTFQSIDPLFAIDLTDPTHPRDAGELHLPGFSTYLQPIDTTHLIGVGRESGWGSGLKLSLFDVSDLAHPVEVDHFAIEPTNWSWWWGSGSEAEWDHHAVGYFPEYHTLTIPVYGTYTAGNYSSLQSSLWIFQVGVTTGFQLLGQVNHDSQVRRSLRIDDQLYSVADDSIQAHPIAGPTAPGEETRFVDEPRTPVIISVDALQTQAYAGPVLSFHITDDAGLRASIDWGDGQSSDGNLAPDGHGAYLVSGTHTYSQQGAFTPSVSLSRGSQVLTAFQGIATVSGPDPQLTRFVTHLYRDLLHREPDNGGLTYWSDLIQLHGVSRKQVAQGILGSAEYRTNEVQALYQKLLGRDADSSGLHSFATFLDQGGTVEQVEVIILDSPEFYQNSGGTNQSFLNSVYLKLLGRDVDPLGSSAFGRALDDGMLRGAVGALILGSAEALQDRVVGFYRSTLHRGVDPGGLAAFTDALRQGSSDQQVLAALAASEEYFGRQ